MVDKWMIHLIKVFLSIGLAIWMSYEAMKLGCPLTDEQDILNYVILEGYCCCISILHVFLLGFTTDRG